MQRIESMEHHNQEWAEYSLGELLSYEQPTQYIVESTEYNDAYETPVLTAGKSFILGYTNEEDGIYDQLPVIIFDDFTTATQYVNFKFKVKSSAMKILTPVQDLVLPKFIFYRMQIINFDHSTHKRYWLQQYSKIRVSVPPLPEQKRIVARIEEMFSQLDAGVETLKKTKAQLAVYRQAVLKEAFDSIEASFYHPLRAAILGSPQNGLYKPKSDYCDNGTPILRIDGFYDGFILSDYSFKRVNLSAEEIERYRLELGDLVVNRVNSMPYLGKCALVRSLIEPTVFESNMMRIKLDTDKVEGDWITYYLSSHSGRKELTKNAKQAVNQASINQTDVGNALVPIPSINEQKRLVTVIESRLSVCDSIDQTIDMALQQSEAMRQSILKDAFEGRL